MLKNKLSVITGCNRGIGKAIVEKFAENGSDIIVCIRNPSDIFSKFINDLQKKTNVKIEIITFDFENYDAVKEAVKKIISFKRDIDILINNAGIANGYIFQMTPIAELEKTLKINFTSQILFTQGISRLMSRSKKGSIVNISSISGIINEPGTLSYGSSKAALIFATKTMATELGKDNIRVNSVAPSLTRTDMYEQMDEKARCKMLESSALKRVCEPEEVANVVMFLASDLSSFVSGQTVRVDGCFNN